MMLKRAIIAMALALPSAAQAEEPVKVVYLYHFPNRDSCSDWVEFREDGTARNQLWEGWVLGLVSGRNLYGEGNGNIAPNVNATGLLGWMDKYCRENPLDTILTAASKLVFELESRAKH